MKGVVPITILGNMTRWPDNYLRYLLKRRLYPLSLPNLYMALTNKDSNAILFCGGETIDDRSVYYSMALSNPSDITLIDVLDDKWLDAFNSKDWNMVLCTDKAMHFIECISDKRVQLYNNKNN